MTGRGHRWTSVGAAFFAAALARGDDAVTALRFGCALAGISVTRPGTAPSMPTLDEVNQVLKQPTQPNQPAGMSQAS